MVRTLHVIGGGAGIGRWLIERVFATAGNIYCYDTNSKALETLPSAVTPCLLNSERGYEPYSNQFQANDWVLLVAPLTVFQDTVAALVPLLRPGCLVVTLSSVQAEPISILKQNIPSDSTFFGCHPFF